MKNSYPKKDIQRNKELEKSGIVFVDIENTYISENVNIGAGTIIFPNVCIWNNVKIGGNCVIQSSTIISDNVTIFDNCFIGPGCLIRDNTNIGINSSIGPHCEIARSNIGVNCILGHKNYIGDAVLCDNVKFGAGAIIANTNWKESFRTIIKENTMVGVNSSLIAPLVIGSNSIIAAGSTITDNCDDNKLLIARTKQITKDRKK